MQIECPPDYKAVVRLGAITYEEASVEILGGVCEAAHECRIQHCKFYDVTPAGDAVSDCTAAVADARRVSARAPAAVKCGR